MAQRTLNALRLVTSVLESLNVGGQLETDTACKGLHQTAKVLGEDELQVVEVHTKEERPREDGRLCERGQKKPILMSHIVERRSRVAADAWNAR